MQQKGLLVLIILSCATGTVLGIGIVQATTLHHLQCLQGNLHRFYALAVNGCG